MHVHLRRVDSLAPPAESEVSQSVRNRKDIFAGEIIEDVGVAGGKMHLEPKRLRFLALRYYRILNTSSCECVPYLYAFKTPIYG